MDFARRFLLVIFYQKNIALLVQNNNFEQSILGFPLPRRCCYFTSVQQQNLSGCCLRILFEDIDI